MFILNFVIHLEVYLPFLTSMIQKLVQIFRDKRILIEAPIEISLTFRVAMNQKLSVQKL